MVQNVQLTSSIPKIAQQESPLIGFSEEDARRLHHPHDDALVVSIRVGDYNVHRVLVDNAAQLTSYTTQRSSRWGLTEHDLIPTNALLVGFGGIRVFPLGAVTFSVTTGVRL